MKIFLFLSSFLILFGLSESARTLPPRYGDRTPQSLRSYSREQRIIGGSPADIADFPHMLVLLDLTLGGFICGASIIHRLWAMSAAHCLDGDTPGTLINFRGGSTNRVTGGFIFFAQSYVLHPAYTPYMLDFDVALVRMQDTSPFQGLHVAPITISPSCVPNTACCQACVDDSNPVTATGWGATETGVIPYDLLQVALPVHDRDECDRMWGWIGLPWFCLTNKVGADTCIADSGSPLVRTFNGQRFQIGIVSFGAPNCGDGSLPSVNTRLELPRIRTWITSVSGV